MPRKKLNELEWFINLPDLHDGARAHFKTDLQKESLEIIQSLREQRRKENPRYIDALTKQYYKMYHLEEDVSELIQDFKVDRAEFVSAIEQLNKLIDVIPEKAWIEIQNKIKKKRMSSKSVVVNIDKELLTNAAQKLGINVSKNVKFPSKVIHEILEVITSKY